MAISAAHDWLSNKLRRSCLRTTRVILFMRREFVTRSRTSIPCTISPDWTAHATRIAAIGARFGGRPPRQILVAALPRAGRRWFHR
jgi:hypothetical protein